MPPRPLLLPVRVVVGPGPGPRGGPMGPRGGPMGPRGGPGRRGPGGRGRR